MNFRVYILIALSCTVVNAVTEADEGVKYANKCEGKF